MGFCDFKDVVAFGNNQLWQPLAGKVKGHHTGLSQKMVSISNSIHEVTEEPFQDWVLLQLLEPEGHKIIKVTDDYVHCDLPLIKYYF